MGCLQYFATLADKKQYGVKIGIRENESGAQTSFYDLTPYIKILIYGYIFFLAYSLSSNDAAP